MNIFSHDTLSFQSLVLLYSAAGLMLMYGIYFFLRICCPKLKIEDVDSDFITGLHSALFTITFLTLGYSLSNVSETVDKLQQNISIEANDLKELDILLALYGKDKTADYRKNLRIYAKSIVVDEWPLLSSYKGSEKTLDYQRQLRKDFLDLDPQTGRELAVYSEIMKTQAKVVELRSSRIADTKSALNRLFFLTNNIGYVGVLIISALMLTQFTWFRFISLNIQIFCVSFIFASSIVLDNPYRGSDTISPEPIQQIADSPIRPY